MINLFFIFARIFPRQLLQNETVEPFHPRVGIGLEPDFLSGMLTNRNHVT